MGFQSDGVEDMWLGEMCTDASEVYTVGGMWRA